MINLKIFWNDFVDLIFPRCCEACDRGLIGNEETICTSCRISLPRIEKDSIHAKGITYRFVSYSDVISVKSFLLFTKKGKVQKLLHALKYKGNKEVGLQLGFMFGQEMSTDKTLPNADLIISVPLHKRKLAKRGYNQSDLLAEGFSRATDIPWSGTTLVRNKYTETQTGKNKRERHENVEGVFEVNTRLDHKQVIIIDDVLTTGATLGACVDALKAAGCKEFHIITIAVAQY